MVGECDHQLGLKFTSSSYLTNPCIAVSTEGLSGIEVRVNGNLNAKTTLFGRLVKLKDT